VQLEVPISKTTEVSTLSRSKLF